MEPLVRSKESENHFLTIAVPWWSTFLPDSCILLHYFIFPLTRHLREKTDGVRFSSQVTTAYSYKVAEFRSSRVSS